MWMGLYTHTKAKKVKFKNFYSTTYVSQTQDTILEEADDCYEIMVLQNMWPTIAD